MAGAVQFSGDLPGGLVGILQILECSQTTVKLLTTIYPFIYKISLYCTIRRNTIALRTQIIGRLVSFGI